MTTTSRLPNRRVRPAIIGAPHFDEATAKWFSERVSRCGGLVEYGSGGSTKLALSLGVKTVITVETDPSFVRALETVPGSERLEICHVDIGKTAAWGRPTSTAKAANWWKYPIAPWLRVEKPKTIDFVLIDGRFRVASFLASLLRAHSGTDILFDDYLDRPAYHVVEQFVAPVETIGRAALFKVPRARSAPDLAAGIERWISSFE